METKIRVEFKETYMDRPVIRECHNMTRGQVIKMYDLNGPDIEWFKWIDAQE